MEIYVHAVGFLKPLAPKQGQALNRARWLLPPDDGAGDNAPKRSAYAIKRHTALPRFTERQPRCF